MGDFETRSKADLVERLMRDEVIAADIKNLVYKLNKRLKDASTKKLVVEIEHFTEQLMTRPDLHQFKKYVEEWERT